MAVYNNDFNNRHNSNIRAVEDGDPSKFKHEKALEMERQKLQLQKENAKKLVEYTVSLERQGGKLTEEQRQKVKAKLEAAAKKKQAEEDKKAIKENLKLQREGQIALLEEQAKLYNSEIKQKLIDGTLPLKEAFKSIGTTLAADTLKIANGIKTVAGDVAKKMYESVNEMMKTYAKYQESINTRIQGTGLTFQSMQSNLLTTVGINPYIKTSVLLDNLQRLVEQGVAFNVEQRAFLETISDKIATTFDAANSSLLRIVRLQQQDSTASRLGMEAYMTRFLNNLFQNTEYLTNEFDSVTASLTEAISQMTTEMGVEFEYMVQKWLGSLSSVGLSSTTVNNLAQAIGYLATGDISGLEGSSVQNLLVMAASRAGLDYGSIMGRLSLEDTNSLLKSVVEYLSEIGSTTNQVVRNQYAQTFGVSVSDLTAAKNIGESIGTIYNNVLSYVGSIEELQYQAGQIAGRTGIASMIENLAENFKYAFTSTIASSPGLGVLYKLATFSQELTQGGTPIHMTGGATLENIALGVLGGASIIGAIGDVINGLQSTFNFASALTRLGVSSQVASLVRGTGIGSRESGFGTSQTAYLGGGGESVYETSLYQQGLENKKTLETYTGREEKTATDIYDVLTGKENIVKVRLQEVNEEFKVNLLETISQNIEDIKEELLNGVVHVIVDNENYLLP